MARRRKWPPTIYPHRGHDRIRVNGKEYYLGPSGSEASRKEYVRLVALLADNTTPAPKGHDSLKVSEIVARWLVNVDKEYDPAGGEPKNFRIAVKPLMRLYGPVLAKDFDAKALENLMVAMATASWMTDEEKAKTQRIHGKLGWCRRVVGRNATRIRTMWSWAEKEKLVPPGSAMHLRTATLSQRDKRVRKSDPRIPAKWEQIQAVTPYVPSPVAAMLHSQWLCGARPEEICIIRTMDLDRTDPKVWMYKPGSHLPFGQHKNAWRGQGRIIPMGRRMQVILTPWLNEADPSAYLFPLVRKGSKGHYTPSAYADAVRRACKKAGIESFCPYQIRHAAKKRVEQLAGTGGAKAFLGQESIESTKQYANQQDQELAKKLARRLS